jgi:hypothetical protein
MWVEKNFFLFWDNQRKVAAEAFNLENKERMKANQSKEKEKRAFDVRET